MIFKVVLEKSPDGGYTSFVPSLPGCISEGDTKAEAIENIKEAIDLYLEPIEDDLIYDSYEYGEVMI
ncbi:MAG TPA: type II toxin-antitoxin system HicB family antitoxin [Candidatus Kapabacteria bacterium]|nr:type II toxin-antitoxin system HicB family antitoxin [Candidatus Kapabacteria bacterium]